jgi:5'-3' exonuclease
VHPGSQASDKANRYRKMGVEGLLRVLKEILDERQVGYITNLYAQARGKRLAIDGHGFLHRLVVIPKFAHALLFNEDYSGPAQLFAFWCRTMKEQGVDLRIVFDGDVTPGKVTEKAERIAKAQAAIDACRRAGAEAVLTWTSGSNKTKLQSAAAGFCNANLVTAVQNELTQDGLGAIIAPYEGDGQLAHMARTGLVDFVLTPDSDLIVHRVPHVLVTPASRSQESLNFTTGDHVYYFPLETLCGSADAEARCQAGGKLDPHVWLAGCLKAHGPRILRLLAFVVGCDYSGGGIRDIGMVKVLPVLFRYGDNTAAVLKALAASHPKSFLPAATAAGRGQRQAPRAVNFVPVRLQSFHSVHKP